MKYSELISFKPIESTIQLLETADKKVAQDIRHPFRGPTHDGADVFNGGCFRTFDN